MSRKSTASHVRTLKAAALRDGEVVVRGSVREQQRIWASIGQDDPDVGTFRGEDANGPYLLVQAHEDRYPHRGEILR